MSNLPDVAEAFRRLADEILNEPDVKRFVDLVAAFRAAKQEVNDLSRDVERALVDLMEGSKEMEVGPNRLEIRWSKQRRWTDNERLREKVKSLALWDAETGEARDAAGAFDVIAEVYRLGGAEARTTALKKHGLDPDDYSEGDWRATVSITPIAPTDEGSNT